MIDRPRQYAVYKDGDFVEVTYEPISYMHPTPDSPLPSQRYDVFPLDAIPNVVEFLDDVIKKMKGNHELKYRAELLKASVRTTITGLYR